MTLNIAEVVAKTAQGDERTLIDRYPDERGYYRGRSVLAQAVFQEDFINAREILKRLTPEQMPAILSVRDDCGLSALHHSAVLKDNSLYKEMKRLIGKERVAFLPYAESPSLLRRIAGLSKKQFPARVFVEQEDGKMQLSLARSVLPAGVQFSHFPRMDATLLRDMWEMHSGRAVDEEKKMEYIKYIQGLIKSDVTQSLALRKRDDVGSYVAIARQKIEPGELLGELSGTYIDTMPREAVRTLELVEGPARRIFVETERYKNVASFAVRGFINAYLDPVVVFGRSVYMIRALPSCTILPGEVISVWTGMAMSKEIRPEALKEFLASRPIDEYFTLKRKHFDGNVSPEDEAILRQWITVVEDPVRFVQNLLTGLIPQSLGECIVEKFPTYLTPEAKSDQFVFATAVLRFIECIPLELLSYCIDLAMSQPAEARRVAHLLDKTAYTMVTFPGALGTFLKTHTVQEYIAIFALRGALSAHEDAVLKLWTSIWSKKTEEFIELVKGGALSRADVSLLHEKQLGFWFLSPEQKKIVHALDLYLQTCS